jgi:CRISPR-associated autoregulator DevR family
MKLWSVSFAYRLGLGFHALNNEGTEGSNLMQPRRIDVGKITYDGISGEIVRRHVLENFVSVCRDQKIDCLPFSEALHPDRGPLGVRLCARQISETPLSKRNPGDLYKAARKAVQSCAVLDIGGYLAAWEKAGPPASEAVVPEAGLEERLANLGGVKDGGRPYTIKRDSTFDVAWLVSEAPQDLSITQHSAYRPSGEQSLFSQTMRSNVYAGVIRADLHRVGTDDYWYLHNPGVERLAVAPAEQLRRQCALVRAIAHFIAAPTGAKTAAWAPHVFLAEGGVLLTSTRTAPFVSPIKVELADKDAPVKPNSGYLQTMEKMKDKDTRVWTFSESRGLLALLGEVEEELSRNGKAPAQA